AQTGSLCRFVNVSEMLARPGEWFILEVIAEGNRIVIKVNGRTTVDFVDEKSTYTSGHFALQVGNSRTVIEFRKVEVKELPAPRKQAGEFQRLFNGKDLAGWKTHPDSPGDWRVEDGVLIGKGPPGFLFSERDDFENFHLRVEARINTEGNSGV